MCSGTQTRKALEALGVQAVANFLRAANTDGAPMAIRLANEALEGGRSVEELLFTESDTPFDLAAKQIDDGKFLIEFGCLPDPLAGDGGEWVVRFDDQGRVVELSGGVQWRA